MRISEGEWLAIMAFITLLALSTLIKEKDEDPHGDLIVTCEAGICLD